MHELLLFCCLQWKPLFYYEGTSFTRERSVAIFSSFFILLLGTFMTNNFQKRGQLEAVFCNSHVGKVIILHIMAKFLDFKTNKLDSYILKMEPMPKYKAGEAFESYKRQPQEQRRI